MNRKPNTAVRSFTDEYLFAYSAEHVQYEIDMFFGLVGVLSDPSTGLGAPRPEDVPRLRNIMVESCVMHLRNLVDFLYLDRPQSSDVIAADFFRQTEWENLRPAISGILDAARVRANKEMAHLTTSRIAGASVEKAWNFVGLAIEIRSLMLLFAENALAARISPIIPALLR
jgi:hypothetical protein